MKQLVLIARVLLCSAPVLAQEDFCKGDFAFDGDVDAEDVTTFLEHFGRGQYDRPCPTCVPGAWCVYQ